MHNWSYKSLFTIIAFLLIAIVVLARFVYPHQKVSAAWWNEGWGYRVAVNIGNTGGSNLTDFQVSISVGTSALINSGKMKSDCSDIRITDHSGKILPFWIEENNPGCNSTTDTKIWIKAPTIPTSGTSFYIYYGNSSASSAQKGKDVFLEFDDFNNSSSISNWSRESNPTTTYTISGGTMASINTSADYSSAVFGANYSDVIVNSRINFNPSQTHGGFVFRAQTTAAENSYQWIIRSGLNDSRIQKRQGGAQSYPINNVVLPSASTSNTWYPVEIRMVGATINTYFNNQLSVNGNINDTTYTSGKIGLLGYDGSQFFDYIFVRKYAVTDPSSSLQSEELSPAPIAYWKFDEGIGTTAFDSTSNKNHGTISNGTWASEDQCISGKCLNFNGTNTSITIPHSSSLNIGGSEITLSTWIRPTRLNYYTFLFKKEVPGYDMVLNPTGTVGMEIFHYFDTQWRTSSCFTTDTVPINKWTHIETVFKQNQYLKIYINGSLSKTCATSFDSPIGTQTSALVLGGAGWWGGGQDKPLQGLMDEPKIFPYASTPAQIKSDYAAGLAHTSSSKGTSANLGSNNKNSDFLSNGLVGYWKMDENIGTTTLDSSGNNNTGTLNNVSWLSGKFGVGTTFDGSTSYINITNNNSLNPTSGITVSTWIKRGVGESTADIITKQGSYGLELYPSSGNAVMEGIINGSRSKCADIVSDTQWNLLTMTYTQGTNKVRLFLNGTECSSYTQADNTGGAAISTNVNDIKIGGPTWIEGYFNGQIDESRIYNRALSPSEVSQLYNWAPGPITYYNFNDTTNDLVGSNSFTTTRNFVQGKYGKAINYQGGTVGTSPSNNILDNDYHTIEFWIKFTGYTTGWQSIFSYQPPGTDRSPGIWRHTGGRMLHWRYATPDTGATAIYSNGIDSGTEFLDNTWYHIAGVKNGTSLTFYVNSTNIGTVAVTSPKVSGSSPFYFGSTEVNLDEFKIYNYARSAKQIVEDMNGGHPIGGSPVGSQLAYYKFDEGYGTIANNFGFGGSALNGTFGTGNSAPTWTNDGKYNKALVFNSTSSQYISNNFDNGILKQGNESNGFTLSAWVKPNGVQSGSERVIVGRAGCHSGLMANSNNTFSFNLAATDCWTNGKTLSGGTISDWNNWHHVVGVYDNRTMNIYIDGVLKNTTIFTSTIYAHGNAFYLGSIGTYAFNGLIDEVKIYNSALTADEIKIDYNRGASLQMGSSTQSIGGTTTSLEYCVPGDTTTCSPPIAEWKMDEGSGATANDTSANNNTGTITGATWTQGKIGSGLNFNGNNLVSIADNNTLDPGQNITIESWFNLTDVSGAKTILSKKVGNDNFWMDIRTNGTEIFTGGYTSTGGGCYSSVIVPTLNTNTWYHVAWTYDRQKFLIYLNGKQISSSNNTCILNSDDSPIYIGSRGSGSNYFTGKIDQIRIYNYARTSAQVAWDYNRGGPVGHWKLDECQGNIAYDWSGIGNTGTISIGAAGSQTSVGTCTDNLATSAAWNNGKTGKYNSSLNFDGVDDYVVVNDNSSLNLNQTGGTVSVWFKTSVPATGSLGGSLVGKTSGYTNGYWFTKFNNKLRISLYGTSSLEMIGNKVITDNLWHHGVATWTSSNLYIYIDGVLDQSQGYVFTFATASNPLYIAKMDSTGEGYFQGQIDDTKIFNYALTPTQIKTLYNNGSVSFN